MTHCTIQFVALSQINDFTRSYLDADLFLLDFLRHQVTGLFQFDPLSTPRKLGLQHLRPFLNETREVFSGLYVFHHTHPRGSQFRDKI